MKTTRHSTRARITYYRLTKEWGDETKCLNRLDEAMREQSEEILASVLKKCFFHLDSMSVSVPTVIQQAVDKRIRDAIFQAPKK